MNKTKEQPFQCPNCGQEIEISEILANRIRKEVERDFDLQKQKIRELAGKEAEQRMGKIAETQRQQMTLELADLKEQLTEKERVAEEARRHEMDLRKKARALEQKQQDVDLEIQRKLDAGKELMSRQLKEQMQQQFDLQLQEKEKQIESLRKSVAEVKRKSEVGSQELQGETLELDLEAKLSAAFPMDRISPVSKGIRGADLLHEVRNEMQETCGTIIWEAKNTLRWNQGWIEKLKDDQRKSTATVAVLVSVALPEGVKQFELVDGVWVCSLQSYLGLTVALRKYLIDLAFARQSVRGKSEKVEMVYSYLAGDEFRQRIEAIVETFNAMHEQLFRERRAMEKNWKEREKQIERMTTNTVGLYGEMRGMIGSGLPVIKALELDDGEEEQ